MKTISLKKDQTKSIADDIQKTLDYINKPDSYDSQSAWNKVGYAEGTLERILKQLKGVYPIV